MSKIKDCLLTEIENNNTSALWIDEPWPTSLGRPQWEDVSYAAFKDQIEGTWEYDDN